MAEYYGLKTRVYSLQEGWDLCCAIMRAGFEGVKNDSSRYNDIMLEAAFKKSDFCFIGVTGVDNRSGFLRISDTHDKKMRRYFKEVGKCKFMDRLGLDVRRELLPRSLQSYNNRIMANEYIEKKAVTGEIERLLKDEDCPLDEPFRPAYRAGIRDVRNFINTLPTQGEVRCKNQSILRAKFSDEGKGWLYELIYSFCCGEGVRMDRTKGDLMAFVECYYSEFKAACIKDLMREADNEALDKCIAAVGAADRFSAEDKKRLQDFLRKYRTPSEAKSEVDFDTELAKWRHNHFEGERDGDYSGEYLTRESQLDLIRFGYNLKRYGY